MGIKHETTSVASKSADFDRDRLQTLVNLAKGERSIVEYSRDSGVNRELIGELVSGKSKRPPTRTSLSKLVSASAMPRANITLYDLLDAAGYPAEEPASKLSLGSAIAAVCSSPHLALMMLLDLLKQRMATSDFDAELYGSWFLIKERNSNQKFVGINAFCDKSSYAEVTCFSMLTLVLETLTKSEHREDISNWTYFILTNDSLVFESAKHLPRLGGRPTVVLFTQRSQTVFTLGVEIMEHGRTNDWKI